MLEKIRLVRKGQRYQIWLEQATFDLEAAELSKKYGFFEWSCFQSEQAAEKALKGVLVHAGWRPPKVHKLALLMAYCNNANNRFRDTRFEFRDLESVTFVSRYPFLIPGDNLSPHKFFTMEDAEKCIHQAKIFLSKIQNLLNG